MRAFSPRTAAALRQLVATGVIVAVSACSTVPEAPPPPPGDEPDVADIPAAPPVAQPQETAKPEPLTIVAVGDIMLGTDFPDDRLPPGDGAGQLAGVAEQLRQADITFGNLEGVLLDGGTAAKHCGRPSRCYVFRSPSRYVGHLQMAGFDVLSLANNHARDFGENGRTATMQTLDEAGILHSGRQGDIASWEVKGQRIALIAFAPYGGSNFMLDLPSATATVRELAAAHDLVIVSFHGGAEGSDKTRVPFAREVFYGEDRGNVVQFARAMVEAGADLVIGHGPHVPRALELYKERLVAYSLGNFSTYRGINVAGSNGLAPILRVTVADDGSFMHGEIISARQLRPNGPQLDESHAAAALIRRVTQADFPATSLHIGRAGTLRVLAPSATSDPQHPQPPPSETRKPHLSQVQ